MKILWNRNNLNNFLKMKTLKSVGEYILKVGCVHIRFFLVTMEIRVLMAGVLSLNAVSAQNIDTLYPVLSEFYSVPICITCAGLATALLGANFILKKKYFNAAHLILISLFYYCLCGSLWSPVKDFHTFIIQVVILNLVYWVLCSLRRYTERWNENM